MFCYFQTNLFDKFFQYIRDLPVRSWGYISRRFCTANWNMVSEVK